MIVAMGTLDTLRADYAVNRRMLDRLTVTAFRINQAAYRGKARTLKRILAKGVDIIWMQAVVGADMPGRVQCGPGLRLPHGGRGIAIHPATVIGSNVSIYPRVMISRGGKQRLAPVIEDGATIYVGAVVAGPVVLSTGCRISANSLVREDVPSGATATGTPATIERSRPVAWRDIPDSHSLLGDKVPA